MSNKKLTTIIGTYAMYAPNYVVYIPGCMYVTHNKIPTESLCNTASKHYILTGSFHYNDNTRFMYSNIKPQSVQHVDVETAMAVLLCFRYLFFVGQLNKKCYLQT